MALIQFVDGVWQGNRIEDGEKGGVQQRNVTEDGVDAVGRWRVV